MSGDLTPVYYLTGIGGTLGTGLWAMRAYMSKQRDRWREQGGKETSLSDKLDLATRAASEATEAIKELNGLLREMKVRLDGYEARLRRVEDTVLTPRWRGDGGP